MVRAEGFLSNREGTFVQRQCFLVVPYRFEDDSESIETIRYVGVIGTEGTITSHAYLREIERLDRDIEVLEKSCPLFVPLAEEGWTEREVTLVIAHEYLIPLRDAGIDVVVLGCTHYPILKGTIGKVFGPGVRLIDSAEAEKKLNKILE